MTDTVLKELERQTATLARMERSPGVDRERLGRPAAGKTGAGRQRRVAERHLGTREGKVLDLGPDEAVVTIATDGAAMYLSEQAKITARDFPVGFDRVSGRFFVRMYNLLNFLDDNWGKVYDAEFFSQEVVNSDVNADGQFVFERFRDRDVTTLLEFRSLWQARWGFEIRF